MKKLALVALFAVAAFGMAFAGTGTGSGAVAITGSVGPYFNITVPPAFTGTISNTAATNWPIGNVVVTSNVLWEVKITSTNGGHLSSVTASTQTIPYTVTLGSLISAATPDTSTTLTAAKTGSQAKTAKTGQTLALSVDIAAPDSYYEAATDYTDTLTLTISAP